MVNLTICFYCKEITSSLYSNFIVNLHIVYELTNWPRNSTNNFPLKNPLFSTINIVRKAVESKFIFDGWGIAFDGESLLSFGDDFVENVVIFSVDNGSSSDTDNEENNFLVLDKGQTDCINDSIGAAEKNSINFWLIKQTQNFAWVYIKILKRDTSMKIKQICKFKANDNVRCIVFV